MYRVRYETRSTTGRSVFRERPEQFPRLEEALRRASHLLGRESTETVWVEDENGQIVIDHREIAQRRRIGV